MPSVAPERSLHRSWVDLPRLGRAACLLLVAACSSSHGGSSAPDAGGLLIPDAGASDDTGVPVPSSAQVTCTPDSLGADVDECECETVTTNAKGAAAPAVYSGTQCGESTTVEATSAYCCADPTYPGSGSCNCEDSSPGTGDGVWGCQDMGGYCTCSYDIQPFGSSVPVAACSPTEGVSGTADGTVCCSDNLLSCICQLENACLAASNPYTVSDCSTAASAGSPAFRTSCPAGQVKVTSCSIGPVTPIGTGPTGTVDSGTPTGAGSCSGSPQVCSYHVTESGCSAAGCSWSSTCSGSASSCDGFGEEGDCEGQQGCDWDDDECEGEADSCSGQEFESSCGGIEGCSWSTGCTGEPASCESITEETTCTDAECVWG